ncbi:hypothetical protein M0813_29623 [Anaeramoeba flamelloides]|uniref:Uncharacterized protein n=1 Tax=Anaeramoeba flamelloides TaxID=1746091 RepID=A0ABQ8XPT9_9EUKA|nr:hypothetical protein M0813_29623 [Anaeramoeba flamelloides]
MSTTQTYIIQNILDKYRLLFNVLHQQICTNHKVFPLKQFKFKKFSDLGNCIHVLSTTSRKCTSQILTTLYCWEKEQKKKTFQDLHK